MISLVGFEYNEFNAKKVKRVNNLKITQGVKVLEVEEVKSSMDKSKILRFGFDYLCDYQPEVGSLEIKGNIFLLMDEKTAKETLNEWKNKKLNNKLLEYIINSVLGRCTVDALLFAQKLNLPSPIPLPRVKVELKSQDAQKTQKSEKDKKK